MWGHQQDAVGEVNHHPCIWYLIYSTYVVLPLLENVEPSIIRFAHPSHAEMTEADRTTQPPLAVSKDLLPGVEPVPLVLSKAARTTGACLSSNGLNMSLTRPTPGHTRVYIYIQIKNTRVFLKPQQMCASLFFFLGLIRQLLFLLCPKITELTSTDEWSGIWHETFCVARWGTSDQGLKLVLSHGTC